MLVCFDAAGFLGVGEVWVLVLGLGWRVLGVLVWGLWVVCFGRTLGCFGRISWELGFRGFVVI